MAMLLASPEPNPTIYSYLIHTQPTCSEFRISCKSISSQPGTFTQCGSVQTEKNRIYHAKLLKIISTVSMQHRTMKYHTIPYSTVQFDNVTI